LVKKVEDESSSTSSDEDFDVEKYHNKLQKMNPLP